MVEICLASSSSLCLFQMLSACPTKHFRSLNDGCPYLCRLTLLTHQPAQHVLCILHQILRRLRLALPKQERHGVASALLFRLFVLQDLRWIQDVGVDFAGRRECFNCEEKIRQRRTKCENQIVTLWSWVVKLDLGRGWLEHFWRPCSCGLRGGSLLTTINYHGP